MAGFINIGFGNIVNRDKIVAVVSPDAAPVKRMVQQGKEEKIVIDCRKANKQYLASPGEDFWCCRHYSRILSESVFMQKKL